MNRKNLIISFLIITWMSGCIPQPNIEYPMMQTTIQPVLGYENDITPTPLTIPTSLATSTPLAKTLQLTFEHYDKKEGFSEIYYMDILCLTENQICLGEPTLIFSTLLMTDADKNKPKGYISGYSWSPEGNRVVISVGGDILVGDIDANVWSNVTHSTGVIESHPIWTRDGRFIFYHACSYDLYGGCRVFYYDNEDKLSFLVESITNSVDFYNVSPDGQTIVYTKSDEYGYSQIHQTALTSSSSHQVTFEEANCKTPSFSSDGQRIVFVCTTHVNFVDESPISEIFIKELLPGNVTKINRKFDGEIFAPIFSPDDNWILFDSFDVDSRANIFAISITSNDLIQITQDNLPGIDPAWRRFP